MTIEVLGNRMVSLGYGKFWRSDAIVGLKPVEEERGPGRRTEVYTSTAPAPIIASRSERAILGDMTIATDETLDAHELRETLADLLDALEGIPDMVRRMLAAEAKMDVEAWKRRVRQVLAPPPLREEAGQETLFSS